MLQQQFADIVQLIKQARTNALRFVNTELINLYWEVGTYISKRVQSAEWGQSVVKELAEYLQRNEPDLKGFSAKNLWRMKQFYENYKDFPKVSALLRQISWTNNLTIFSRTKSIDEQEFYLNLCVKEQYSTRELERQINSGVFERTMMANSKLSPVVREIHPETVNTFKDSYVFDFLNLPETYNEIDLQKGLVREMKKFVTELGKDFLFVGEEYKKLFNFPVGDQYQ